MAARTSGFKPLPITARNGSGGKAARKSAGGDGGGGPPARPASTYVRRPAPGRGRNFVESGRWNGSSLFAIDWFRLTSNRPEFQRQPWELPGDVQPDAAGILQLLPQRVVLIELEV